MDLVVNHTSTSTRGSWSRARRRENPKRDWYWWRDEPPNDWRSASPGSAWELDETTGEYYLHLFARKQPDLNWENPEVREAVYSMMRWWLDRGVDGFRMDVINLISKDLSDGRLHLRAADPRVPARDARARCSRGATEPTLTVGEMPGVTLEEAQLFTDPARGEVDMVFQFEHVDARPRARRKWDVHPLRLTDLKRSFGRWQEGLAERGWNSLYWNNHDQPRIVSRFGDDAPEHRVRSAKMLGTVLHLHRGTPYVYQGEELGMTNAPLRRDRRVPRHRVAQPLRRGDRRPATTRTRVLGGAADDEPRQRAHADAVGRGRRTPASPPASRGSRSTRTTRDDQRRRGGARTPTRCSTTTGG